MENKIIDKFHDQRDYYVMMELVEKLKERISVDKFFCNRTRTRAKVNKEIDNLFGSFVPRDDTGVPND